MKMLKMIGNCLLGFVLLCLLLIVILSFNTNDDIPSIGNHSVLVVKGKSMKPVLKNGDLIFIDRKIQEEYEVNDIVSFLSEDSGAIITHKIVEVKEIAGETRYFTKGVNNVNQDNYYITNEQIIGEYEGVRIPIIGYISIFASTNVGYVLLVILPLALVFILLVIELIKEVKKKRGEI